VGETLRVGVVGAGLIAGCHVRAYTRTEDVEVVAVADPHVAKAEQLAATVGATVCRDLDDVLELGPDVISVCTPPRTHADLTVRSIEAGRHVLCEKPVALTLADALRIQHAAETSDRVVMIGHVSRFEPDHRAAQELVAAGHVGEVAMMVHSMTTSLPGWSEGGWLARPEESGGPLVDLSAHSFDYLTWVIGSPAVRVHAVAADSPVGPRSGRFKKTGKRTQVLDVEGAAESRPVGAEITQAGRKAALRRLDPAPRPGRIVANIEDMEIARPG